jgi:hypothetical protein
MRILTVPHFDELSSYAVGFVVIEATQVEAVALEVEIVVLRDNDILHLGECVGDSDGKDLVSILFCAAESDAKNALAGNDTFAVGTEKAG